MIALVQSAPPAGVADEAWSRIARLEGSRWAIVERTAVGEPIGTAYRDASGGKTFDSGGKRGLIVAWPLSAYAGSSLTSPVFACEGASDTAALLSLGLDAVGVPMAGHCGAMLAELLSGRHVVIVADADDAGRKGAAKIAAALIRCCASVRTIEPPNGAEDARAAVITGANREAFLALASAAAPLTRQAPVSDGAAVLVRLADVEPEPVSWLWPGRIPLGKLTLIAGDPGLGKSFLTLYMAARVSRGKPWPDAPGVLQREGGVVLLSAEDGVADTIVPRLVAAGADLSRMTALEAIRVVATNRRESQRPFDLSRDLPALESAIRSEENCRLVVIDPVTAYLGGVDSHRNADIRGLLAPLSGIATRHGVAIVAVTHLNKSSCGPAIYRAMGSLAFTAAARAAWAVTEDKDDPRRRLFLPMKNNLASDTGGLAYRLELATAGGCPVVTWDAEPVYLSADDALTPDQADCGGRTERDDAADWLRALLAGGPRPAREVEEEARAAGHSMGTARRAKAAIGVESRKSAFGGHWEWGFPSDAPEGARATEVSAQGAQSARSERLGAEHAESDGEDPKKRNAEE